MATAPFRKVFHTVAFRVIIMCWVQDWHFIQPNLSRIQGTHYITMALRYNLVWCSLVEPALTLNASAWSKIEAGRDSERVAAGGWASYRQSRRAQEACRVWDGEDRWDIVWWQWGGVVNGCGEQKGQLYQWAVHDGSVWVRVAGYMLNDHQPDFMPSFPQIFLWF